MKFEQNYYGLYSFLGDEFIAKYSDDIANGISLEYGILGERESIIKQFVRQHGHKFEKEPKKAKTLKKKKVTKNNDPLTKEWRKIRTDVLKVYGTQCMCCGITPSKVTDVHVDHIKPKSKYPELIYDYMNLQILCKGCNEEKSDKHFTDYRKWYNIRDMKTAHWREIKRYKKEVSK